MFNSCPRFKELQDTNPPVGSYTLIYRKEDPHFPGPNEGFLSSTPRFKINYESYFTPGPGHYYKTPEIFKYYEPKKEEEFKKKSARVPCNEQSESLVQLRAKKQHKGKVIRGLMFPDIVAAITKSPPEDKCDIFLIKGEKIDFFQKPTNNVNVQNVISGFDKESALKKENNGNRLKKTRSSTMSIIEIKPEDIIRNKPKKLKKKTKTSINTGAAQNRCFLRPRSRNTIFKKDKAKKKKRVTFSERIEIHYQDGNF